MTIENVEFEYLPGIPFPLLRSEPSPCPYLPVRESVVQVLAAWNVTEARYRKLMDQRFRRTGGMYYRPACPECDECVPIRVPVAEFAPSRSQRRVARRNRDLRVKACPITPDDEHFDLFSRYQAYRHEGHMADSREAFEDFLGPSPIETFEITLRLDGQLVGVSVVDQCLDAVSSVYFYYDPEFANRSLGVFSGLCEIAEARRRGLRYWYVGYFVAGCAKMSYKTRFRPCELLGADGKWARCDSSDAAGGNPAQ